MGYEDTHILSFVSPSSQSLANLRASLAGEEWEKYVDIVRPFTDNVRASTGVVPLVYNAEEFYGIGQVWGFRVKSKDIPVFANAFTKLMETFDLERCGNATMALAQASSALDYVKEYVQEREQFGKPIVDFQAVQIKLADMLMKVEASRLLIHRAVFNAANGLPDILESSSAKCFANEIAREVTTTAMQLMGGYGFNKEYGMERKVRDAFGWGIAGGTIDCLLYTSPSPRDKRQSRMPSSA